MHRVSPLTHEHAKAKRGGESPIPEKEYHSFTTGRPRHRLLARLLPRLVALLVFFVRWIKTGELGALLYFLHQPAFHELVLGALSGDEIGQVLRDHYRAVVVGDDDVVRKDRTAAAADRLVPADKRQLVHRSRARHAGPPHRQAGTDDAVLVAHHAVGDQRADAALDHAHAQDVAENAGAGDA